MYQILLVGIGGFIGAALRYLISGWAQGSSSFPIGTLSVNVLGSFLLGGIMYLSEYRGFFSEEVRVFLTIGVIGAFTTMSTFGYESFRLIEQREMFRFSINTIATTVLVIISVYLGRVTAIKIGGM